MSNIPNDDDFDKKLNEMLGRVSDRVHGEADLEMALACFQELELLGKMDGDLAAATEYQRERYIKAVTLRVAWALAAMPAVQRAMTVVHPGMAKDHRAWGILHVMAEMIAGQDRAGRIIAEMSEKAPGAASAGV